MGCQKEEVHTRSAEVESGKSVLSSRSEGSSPEDLYDAAVLFRNHVEQWREGEGPSVFYSPAELAAELSNTYNMLWGKPASIYGNQTVVFDSVMIGDQASLGSQDALAAYEGVKQIVQSAMEAFTSPDAGLRFLSVEGPIDRTSGTYLHVYANVGGGLLESPVDVFEHTIWGDIRFDPDAYCINRLEADDYIAGIQNGILGNHLRYGPNGQGIPNTNPRSAGLYRVRLLGNATVALNFSEPEALDADIIFFPQQFPFGANYFTQQPCQTSRLFVTRGQYRVHFDCNSDELCFDIPAKTREYVFGHGDLGDGPLRTAFINHRGLNDDPDMRRIGAYVQSKKRELPNDVFHRSHLSKFFYGYVTIITSEEHVDLEM